MAIHVLVADDEPHIGRIIQTKLEQGPFRVTLVNDGPGVLAALEGYPDVALVLLDVMMPGLTGLEVLARIRGDARWARLPCVILTAAGHDEQRDEAEIDRQDRHMAGEEAAQHVKLTQALGDHAGRRDDH